MRRAHHHRPRRPLRLIAPLLLAGLGAGCSLLPPPVPPPSSATSRGEAVRHAIETNHARSVILFIGDGMGDSEITIARNYRVGAAGRLAMDHLPLTGACTTYSVAEKDPTRPVYVTDSAASATAWATGHKTSNRRLSTAPITGQPLPTLLELAQAKGLRTGNVTTAELTDATPAALDSHINDRGCQGPADMAKCSRAKKAAGGPGSIAEQTVDHHVDVLLGGGRARFAQKITGGPDKGKTVLASAKAQGYAIVTNADQLRTVAPGQKVLGLFARRNMTREWKGKPARRYPGSGPQRCLEHQRPDSEPSLAEMTREAIELLDAPAGKGPGFFLQVEGASIDKADHAGDPCGQIGETVALDGAVQVALDYAKKHPDTLIIVTADHGHTSQILPPPTRADHSPGAYSILITVDEAMMTVGYATNRAGRSQAHTGTQVRIAAQGPSAVNFAGVIDNTDIFRTIARALDLNKAAAEAPRPARP